jgi:DNA-directed RNA polymerase specialized sigma24 family protein
VAIKSQLKSESHPSEDAARTAGLFATTHWSVVLAAGERDSPPAVDALEKLCRAYWYPLYACIRRRGCSAQDAEDLTQGFFAVLLAGNYLARADRERGRFRTFLLTAFNNFLHNEHDRSTALKRGGGREIVSWDEHTAEGRYAREPVGGLSPEQIYEKRWVATLLERVLGRLRGEFDTTECRELFDQLKAHLWGEDEAIPYAQLSGQFAMTVSALKVTVHRLRRRYRDLLREEIAQTVADPAEIDDEIQYLIRVTSQ